MTDDTMTPTGRFPTKPEMQNLPGTLAYHLEMMLTRNGLAKTSLIMEHAQEMLAVLSRTAAILEDGLQDEAAADRVREQARALLNKLERRS